MPEQQAIYGDDIDAERARQDKVTQEKEALLSWAYKECFGTPAGQLVFRDIMEQCHVFASIYTKSADIYYREGRRSVGLYLMHRRELSYEEVIEELRDLQYAKEPDLLKKKYGG
uniref:Bbp19-like phage domain-containing protein n=1 Tax=viral metagenome TaxID=1070528 RepID=A0A6M3L953_9ZZZZ